MPRTWGSGPRPGLNWAGLNLRFSETRGILAETNIFVLGREQGKSYRNAAESLVFMFLVSTEPMTSLSPFDSKNKRGSPGNRNIKAILYGVVGGGLCILFLAFVVSYCLRRNRRRRIKNNGSKYFVMIPLMTPFYTSLYPRLKRGFSLVNMLHGI